MTVFDVLSMIGGLCMFLLGMRLMSSNLEKCAGKKMSGLLLKFAGTPLRGFALGFIFTLVIQSSSATTAMVVGFVSAGMMTLEQSVGVIIGANLGTTVTAWIISLTGINSTNFWLQLLKPASWTPILAFIGIILVMASKKAKKNEIGMVLLGFAVLMFGISTMSSSVSGLSSSEEFGNILTAFTNPFAGVAVGTVLTAIIQSSSASVGILQALCVTGKITFQLAIPVILGENFGACVTALIASFGATKDAKRSALVHLFFSLIGKTVVVCIFYLINIFAQFSFLSTAMTSVQVAMVHTLMNLFAAILVLPFSKLMVKLTKVCVRNGSAPMEFQSLDDHLLSTPDIALANCETAVQDMALISVASMKEAIQILHSYDEPLAKKIREKETLVDKYEDRTGSFLIKVSANLEDEKMSANATELLRLIGDFERISDHSVNLVESAEEMKEKKFKFSPEAQKELGILENAVAEILDLSLKAFIDNDMDAAVCVEPLEQVVDHLKDQIKKNHAIRLQKSQCTLEHGFILSDILTNLERVSDHCSNIAGCILETRHDELDMHRYLDGVKTDSSDFSIRYQEYQEKYVIQ